MASRHILYLLFPGLIALAFSPIFVRLAGNVEPLALATFRTMFASLILLPFWIFQKTEIKDNMGSKVSRDDYILCFFTGALLGLHFTLWITSLKYTSVASASILVTIHPIILLSIEWAVLNKNFSKKTVMGIFLALAGSIFLGYSDRGITGIGSNPIKGDLFALAAALFFAIYFLGSQRLRQKLNWLNYVFPLYTAAFFCCFSFAIAGGINLHLPTGAYLAALGLAIGPQIIGHGSFNYAVKTVSPTLLSSLILAEPLLATLIAIPFFGEIPGINTYLAMLIISTGLYLTWSKGSSNSNP
ncbi:DMT family transporter [Candidatus Riflebacteria bacterium]